MSITFNINILHSLPPLQEFFQPQEEIEHIRRYQESSGSSLTSCGIVTWLLMTAPLRLIGAVFLESIALLLNCAGAKELALRCHLLKQHLMKEVYLLASLFLYGAQLIAPLYNVYAGRAEEVYLTPSLSSSELSADPEIADILRDQTTVDFYQAGVCRGITSWFLALYLRTRDSYMDRDEHFRAVASIFQDGAPPQAALLQALLYPEEPILHLKRREVQSTSLNRPLQEVGTLILALPSGVYEVWLPYHRMAYVKVHAALGYLINPSIGIIKVEGENQSLKAAAHFQAYRNRENGHLPDLIFISNDIDS